MKAFDKLGSWVLDTKSGLIFGITILIFAIAAGTYHYLKKPTAVVISAGDFTCVAAEPHGLETRCTEYRRFR
jgi:hypothetical protein